MPRGRAKHPLPSSPGGTREDLNPAAIPDGQWLSSSNWIVRDGVGRPRPGYNSLAGSPVAALDRVIGIGYRGTTATTTQMVVHTLTAAYKYSGAAFTNITGTWTAAAANDLVRFTNFIQSNTLYIVRVNPDNAPFKWDGGAGNFVTVGGTPPAGARDITTTNGRVVVFGVTGQLRRVQWSNFNDQDTWTATDIAELVDTPGEIIAGRALGPLSCAVLKEDAIYLGVAQAAAAAFRFQYIGPASGPVGPAAVVEHRGALYWLGQDWNLHTFDGTSAGVIDLGSIRSFFRNTVSVGARDQTVGWVIPRAEPELWFTLVKVSGGTMVDGFRVNLVTGAADLHTFTDQITAAGPPGQFNNNESDAPEVQIGSVGGKLFHFGRRVVDSAANGGSDDGTNFAWNFVHGWKAPSGLGTRTYLDGIVSYWKKATNAVTVTVGVTASDSLGDADAEVTGTFTTTTDSDHLLTAPFVNTKKQFYKVKHSGTGAPTANSATDLEHRGAAILGWPRGMV